MVLDITSSLARRAAIESERIGDPRRQTSNAGEISRARANRASRPMAQEEPCFTQQVRTRITRDGEEIDVSGRDAAELEADADCLLGKSGVVLDAPEPLLFDCGDELPVADEDRRHITVVGIDADDIHSVSAGMRAAISARNRSRKCASVK